MEIALDFDGTCVTHAYPEVGVNIGAQEVLKELVNNGHNLILFTMRSGETLADAEKWFEDNDIPLYGVQFNPGQHSWTQSNKCYAQLYIDDAALGCPTIFNPIVSKRPFLDWRIAKIILKQKGLI